MKEWTKEEVDSVCELVGGNPGEIIRQLQSRLEELNQKVDELEKENASLKKDTSRVDWLESCNESHGFCHTGWGEYRYYSYVEGGYPSVRQVLDAAIQAINQ